MKTWYIYSDKKEKFVKISKFDLAAGDIVCCKNENGFVCMDNSTVFVVIHPGSETSEFQIRSLVIALGAVIHAYKTHGIYFFPYELDQYLIGDQLNEELVDMNWGFLQFRKDAIEWVDYVNSKINYILEKKCSD
jgi:hypothetical protein